MKKHLKLIKKHVRLKVKIKFKWFMPLIFLGVFMLENIEIKNIIRGQYQTQEIIQNILRDILGQLK